MGAGVPGAGAGRRGRAERRGRPRQPVVADRRPTCISELGELCLQPGRPQRRDQAVAAAHRRADDGRLVPVERRSATSWPAGRRASSARCRCRDLFSEVAVILLVAVRDRVRAGEADQALDGAACSTMALEEYKRKRDFTKTPEPAGTRRAEAAASGSSASRSISPATCTTTSASSTTACCCRGRCRRGRRSIRRPSGSRCTSRIIRSTTASSKASSPKATAPASSCSGTAAPGRRRVDDVDAALKKGDLKFTLDGYKLKGSWVLVRTSGRYLGAREGGGDRSWLLIKHSDDWAGDLDIAEFAPRSVKSDGDFEDILAAGQPGDLAHRTAPRRAATPARCSRRSSSGRRQLKASARRHGHDGSRRRRQRHEGTKTAEASREEQEPPRPRARVNRRAS